MPSCWTRRATRFEPRRARAAARAHCARCARCVQVNVETGVRSATGVISAPTRLEFLESEAASAPSVVLEYPVQLLPGALAARASCRAWLTPRARADTMELSMPVDQAQRSAIEQRASDLRHELRRRKMIPYTASLTDRAFKAFGFEGWRADEEIERELRLVNAALGNSQPREADPGVPSQDRRNQSDFEGSATKRNSIYSPVFGPTTLDAKELLSQAVAAFGRKAVTDENAAQRMKDLLWERFGELADDRMRAKYADNPDGAVDDLIVKIYEEYTSFEGLPDEQLREDEDWDGNSEGWGGGPVFGLSISNRGDLFSMACSLACLQMDAKFFQPIYGEGGEVNAVDDGQRLVQANVDLVLSNLKDARPRDDGGYSQDPNRLYQWKKMWFEMVGADEWERMKGERTEWVNAFSQMDEIIHQNIEKNAITAWEPKNNEQSVIQKEQDEFIKKRLPASALVSSIKLIMLVWMPGMNHAACSFNAVLTAARGAQNTNSATVTRRRAA